MAPFPPADRACSRRPVCVSEPKNLLVHAYIFSVGKAVKNTSKLGKIAAIAAGAVLVYSILGFLLLPVVLKNIVVQELTRFTRRPVAIRGIDFNPYTMSFTVRDFQVEEPDGGIIFSVASVHATFVPVSSFLGHVWVFKGAVV